MQSFENACKRLDEILVALTSDDISLDTSLELYAEAAQLVQLCSSKLDKAQLKVKKIDDMLNLEVKNA